VLFVAFIKFCSFGIFFIFVSNSVYGTSSHLAVIKYLNTIIILIIIIIIIIITFTF